MKGTTTTDGIGHGVFLSPWSIQFAMDDRSRGTKRPAATRYCGPTRHRAARQFAMQQLL